MSPEKLTAVLEAIAVGESSRNACLAAGTSGAEFWRTIAKDESARERYLRARDSGLERWAEEIVELADECRLGVIEDTETGPTGRKTTKTSKRDMVERTRLQIESRKWLLAKLRPKKYGDAMQLTGAGGGPLQLVVQAKDVDVV